MSLVTPDAPDRSAEAGIGSWNGERTGQFRDGSWGVRAKDGRIIVAWAVDIGVVMSVSAFAGIGVAKSSGSVGAGVALGIVTWLLVPWLYGFFCVGGNTLGTLAAGTRLVKLRDGRGPGTWRSSWLMFLRTALFALMPINAILGAMNGDDMDVERKHHVSIGKAEARALHTQR